MPRQTKQTQQYIFHVVAMRSKGFFFPHDVPTVIDRWVTVSLDNAEESIREHLRHENITEFVEIVRATI